MAGDVNDTLILNQEFMSDCTEPATLHVYN